MGGGFKLAGAEARENEGGNRCTVYLYAVICRVHARAQACVIIIQPYLLCLFIIVDETMSFLRCRHRFFHLVFHLPGIWYRCSEPDSGWRQRKREILINVDLSVSLPLFPQFSFPRIFLSAFHFLNNCVMIVLFFLLKNCFNFFWVSTDRKTLQYYCNFLLLFLSRVFSICFLAEYLLSIF